MPAPPVPEAVANGGRRVLTNGTCSLSMFLPTKPSTAGSSVSDVAIVIATARIAPVARPLTKSMPIRYMPASEMITVQPAKNTALPDVATAFTTAACGSMLVVDALPVAGDDEQRVVDADADADHLRELGRELRDRHQVGHERDRRRGRRRGRTGVHDRQAHGQHRAEHDQQDHDGGQQAEPERGRRLAVLEVTGQLGLQGSAVRGRVTMSWIWVLGRLGQTAARFSPNWISANAIGLSDEICCRASGSNGDRTPTTSGTCSIRVRHRSIAARAAGSSSDGLALNTTIAVSPARAGNLVSRRSKAFCESVLGRLNVWLKLLPMRSREHVDADEQRRSSR